MLHEHSLILRAYIYMMQWNEIVQNDEWPLETQCLEIKLSLFSVELKRHSWASLIKYEQAHKQILKMT